MVASMWNFSGAGALHDNRFSVLRSRPGLRARHEILRRFSSSSLPPSFVSGRFAVLSSSAAGV